MNKNVRILLGYKCEMGNPPMNFWAFYAEPRNGVLDLLSLDMPIEGNTTSLINERLKKMGYSQDNLVSVEPISTNDEHTFFVKVNELRSDSNDRRWYNVQELAAGYKCSGPINDSLEALCCKGIVNSSNNGAVFNQNYSEWVENVLG